MSLEETEEEKNWEERWLYTDGGEDWSDVALCQGKEVKGAGKHPPLEPSEEAACHMWILDFWPPEL